MEGGGSVEDMEHHVTQVLLRLEETTMELLKNGTPPEKVCHETLKKLCLMEFRDGNYHRLGLVKELKRRLKESFGEHIEERVRQCVGSTPDLKEEEFTEEAMAAWKESMCLKKPFVRIQDSVMGDIKKAMENVLVRVSAELERNSSIAPDQPPIALGWNQILASFNSRVRESSDEEDDDKNSLKGFSFSDLPPYGDIPKIAIDMKLTNVLEVRKQALERIQEFSPGDLMHNQFWPPLKKGILHGLMDPNESIRDGYFELMVKLYDKNDPVHTGEVYLCFLTHLTALVRKSSPLYVVPASADEETQYLDTRLPAVHRLILKFRLLNVWQRDVPNYWIYYPDILCDRIMVGTFNLLRMVDVPVPKETEWSGLHLGPFDLIAMADPTALWFEQWVAHSNPRPQLVNYMWQTGMLQELVWRTYCLSPRDTSAKKSSPTFEITSPEKEALGHIKVGDIRGIRHCMAISMLGIILRWKDGRLFFENIRGVHLPANNDKPPCLTPSRVVLPDQIETTRIKTINNLVRVVISGSAWRCADKDDAESDPPSAPVELHCATNPLQSIGLINDVTLGWWNDGRKVKDDEDDFVLSHQQQSLHVPGFKRIKLSDILAAYIRYMIFSTHRATFEVPSLELGFFSLRQSMVRVAGSVLLEVAKQIRCLEMVHLTTLLQIFSTLTEGSLLAKTISEIFCELLSHPNRGHLSLLLRPWVASDTKDFSDSAISLLLSEIRRRLDDETGKADDKKMRETYLKILTEISFTFALGNSSGLPGMQRLFQSIAGVAQRFPPDDSIEWTMTMSEILSRMACSAMGMLVLEENNLLLRVAEHAANCLEKLASHECKDDDHTEVVAFNLFISSLASSVSGARAIAASSMPNVLLKKLQLTLSDENGLIEDPLRFHRPLDENPGFSAFMQTYGHIFSSLVTYEMCRSTDASGTRLMTFIIQNLLLQRSSSHDKAGRTFMNVYGTLNFTEWHHIGIRFVQEMLASIDNMLYLEHSLSLSDEISEIEREYLEEPALVDGRLPPGVEMIRVESAAAAMSPIPARGARNPVIDELSLGRFHICQALNSFGGISERWYGFHPKSRDISVPWRSPSSLPSNKDVFKSVTMCNITLSTVGLGHDWSLKAVIDATSSTDPSSEDMAAFRGILEGLVCNCLLGARNDNEKIREFCTKRFKGCRQPSKIWKTWAKVNTVYFEDYSSFEGVQLFDHSIARSVFEQFGGQLQVSNRRLALRVASLLRSTLGSENASCLACHESLPTDSQPYISKVPGVIKMENAVVCMCVEYGVRCGLIAIESEEKTKYAEEDMKSFFSAISPPATGFVDWFVMFIYFLHAPDDCRIDGDAGLMLQSISNLSVSVFLWPERGAAFKKGGNEADKKRKTEGPGYEVLPNVAPILTVCHLVICILERELPHICVSCETAGVSLINIIATWVRQCFFNTLDFSEIVAYITFPLCFGADYQVYFIVALFRHLQDEIKELRWKFAIDELLLHNPIVEFDPSESLKFMKELESSYRDMAQKEMAQVLK